MTDKSLIKASVANFSDVMETRDHFKNGASLKSQTSRINLMKKIITIALVIFVILSMESCSSNSSQAQAQSQPISINNNLFGAWEGEYGFLFFFDNGTYYGSGFRESGKYSIYENYIMLTYIGYQGSESSYLYTFSVSGDTLTLLEYGASEDRKVTFKKVKK